MKKLLIFILLNPAIPGFAQQFGLYNTKTLYDSFENPSQKAFKADTTKQYAFNFLIPTVGGNTSFGGPAQIPFKTIIFQNTINGSDLVLGEEKTNKIFLNSNAYIAMFRIFKAVKYNREMGFAWQIKSDTYANITNETVAIFKNFSNFKQGDYTDAFTNKGTSQTYHQFSFSYREDITKRLGVGVKLSYLSGIAYNKLKINSSSITINQDFNFYNLSLQGKFKSNYLLSQEDENGNLQQNDKVYRKLLWPGIKNPGFAITASANYKLRGGWYILGNLKDIGFIHWNRKTYNFNLDKTFTITNASGQTASNSLSRQIDRMFYDNYKQKGFTSFINGKIEFLINKDFDNYQPNFLLSQNLSANGTDAVLINNLRLNNSLVTVSTGYNTNSFMFIGGQYMLKKPNFEFFIGSDNLLKTFSFGKGIISEDPQVGKGYTGASFYLGFSMKYGQDMEHMMNANNIPGFGKEDDRPGFFGRMLSIFKKKKKKD